MLLTLFMVLVTAIVVVGCVVAIVMSTSQGSRWLRAAWSRRDGDDAERS